MERTYVRYEDVRRKLADADQLFYRGRSLHARAIQMAGRSEYSHAAKIVRARGVVMVAETAGFLGARIVTLSSQIKKYPGQIDVYQTNPDGIHFYDRYAAAEAIFRFAGQSYGWKAIVLNALSYVPGYRWFTKADFNDTDFSPRLLPYCSALCSWADRMGGYDPVKNLADCWTTPGDLAKSPFYKYQFTLA